MAGPYGPKNTVQETFFPRKQWNFQFVQYWILAFFDFRDKAPLKRLLVRVRRNCVLAVFFDQLTSKKIFSSIREKWRWVWSTTCVGHFYSKTRKVALWGPGGCTSNRPKSGYARPIGTNSVPGVAHVHREAVGHLGPDPPPLSETAWPFARENTFFKKIR